MTTFVSGGPPLSLRRIAVPVEHGAWAIAGEPIALGLLAVPSRAGAALAVCAAATFLARQPTKIFLSDWYRGALTSRGRTAAAIAAGYLAVAAVMLAMTLQMSGVALLMPLFFALPFAAVQVVFDAVNESRQLLAEVCGATGIAASAAMIAIAGGEPALAAPLWIAAAGRSVGAVVYVRARLRLEKAQRRATGERARSGGVIAVHVVAAAGLSILWIRESFGSAAVAAALVLLLRAAAGLHIERSATAKQIGLRELVYGSIFVTLMAAAV